MSSSLTNDIALRIALAARALPDTDPARLLKVLDAVIGLPPTVDSLSSLTVKKLKAALDGELSSIDTGSLKTALSALKGENGLEMPTLPAVEPCAEGDMPGSIRVACASNRGEELDGHFGSCQRFLVYQIDEQAIRLVDIRDAYEATGEGDKNAQRAGLIEDCNVLFVASIGGPAAAKVVKANIHPMKYPTGGNIRELLAELQQVLAGSPPPWLAKVMGHRDEERVRFERQEASG